MESNPFGRVVLRVTYRDAIRNERARTDHRRRRRGGGEIRDLIRSIRCSSDDRFLKRNGRTIRFISPSRRVSNGFVTIKIALRPVSE